MLKSVTFAAFTLLATLTAAHAVVGGAVDPSAGTMTERHSSLPKPKAPPRDSLWPKWRQVRSALSVSSTTF